MRIENGLPSAEHDCAAVKKRTQVYPLKGGGDKSLISTRLLKIVEVCCSLQSVHAMQRVQLPATVMLCFSFGAARTQIEEAAPGATKAIGISTDNAKRPASKGREREKQAVSVFGALPVKPTPVHGQDAGVQARRPKCAWEIGLIS